MAFKRMKPKDPHAVKLYTVDWSDWLRENNIAASIWHVPDGLELEAETFEPKVATALISGGTVGEEYELTNEITTDEDPEQVDERTMIIPCQET